MQSTLYVLIVLHLLNILFHRVIAVKRIHEWVNEFERARKRVSGNYQRQLVSLKCIIMHQKRHSFGRELHDEISPLLFFVLPHLLTWKDGEREGEFLCESRSAVGPEHQQLRTRKQERRECTYSACASERVAHPKLYHIPRPDLFMNEEAHTCVIKGRSDLANRKAEGDERAIFMHLLSSYASSVVVVCRHLSLPIKIL